MIRGFSLALSLATVDIVRSGSNIQLHLRVSKDLHPRYATSHISLRFL